MAVIRERGRGLLASALGLGLVMMDGGSAQAVPSEPKAMEIEQGAAASQVASGHVASGQVASGQVASGQVASGQFASASTSQAAAPVVTDPPRTADGRVQALSLERIFASPDLAGEQPRQLKISPDGRFVTALRPRPDERERFDLWALDPGSGQWRMLVDSKKFAGGPLSEAEKMQRERARIGGTRGIVAYQWTADSRALLVPLDGDLYLATLDGKVSRLTQSEAGELNPEVSPKGRYLSFVRDQNLVIRPLGPQGREKMLTRDGGGTILWGEAEFVAQEEMDRVHGYWWAPDDRRLVVARVDESPVAIVKRAAIGAEGTEIFEQRYPLAGTANARVDLYVFAPGGGKPVKIDLGPNPDIYVARVDWAPDGSAIFVQRQSRDQTRLDLLRVDPATGRATEIFAERSPHWVALSHNYRMLKDSRILWWSQRDGFGHLYLFIPQAAGEGTWVQLTRGPWEVAQLLAVDEDEGTLVFTANRDDVLERHIYRLSYRQPGQDPVRITEPGFWSDGTADTRGSRLIITRSNPEQPPQLYLADANGQRLAWINENKVAGAHPYAPYRAAHQQTRFGTILAVDGSTLYWSMITPAIQPGRRYPVFMEHYGGPGAQTVKRAWAGPLHQFLVAQGYIVFRIDNRGSPNRGRAFETQIYGALGTVEVEDQLAGVNWLKQQPFVDPRRVAAYGWSYGGYMSLRLLERAPGMYAAAIAGAPVTRWELYDTHYTERYLRKPQDHRDWYQRAAVVAEAGAIRDPLLLIHGMADDNVVFDHATAFMAAAQAAGVRFETAVYPGQTHAFGDMRMKQHSWRTIVDFLNRRLQPTP